MGELREYRLTYNGIETTMQLTAQHAELMGATPTDVPDPQPAAGELLAGHALVRPDVKADAPPNKARTARDKHNRGTT